MSRISQAKLERRVIGAAEAALAHSKSVSPIDVLNGVGWLPGNVIDSWRQGRVEYLDAYMQVEAAKLAYVIEYLRRWAEGSGLIPAETEYVAATRDRRQLRFTAGGDEAIERACRTHWISPGLSEAQRERLTQRQGKVPDLVVVQPIKDWICAECGGMRPGPRPRGNTAQAPLFRGDLPRNHNPAPADRPGCTAAATARKDSRQYSGAASRLQRGLTPLAQGVRGCAGHGRRGWWRWWCHRGGRSASSPSDGRR